MSVTATATAVAECGASVPEVDCPKHGVFAYRSTECPGCANEVAAYRHHLAGEARTFYYTEYARVQAEVDEQRRQHVEQLNAAQARLDAHDRTHLVFPDSRGISQLEVDQRDQDGLDTRRAELAARIADIGPPNSGLRAAAQCSHRRRSLDDDDD